MRGSLIFNLDPKWISHLWLQDLPNVINAHDTEDLHLALCWLGRELKRRTRAAYYSAGRHRPGPRQRRCPDRRPVRGTQLRHAGPERPLDRDPRPGQEAPEGRPEPDLPKKSPAIAALSALSCAGRASDIHMWLVAQLLTVESTGVKDSTIRTNAGIKAMARWDKPGWDMAVGKHIPMPSPSAIPGRIQRSDRRGAASGNPGALPPPRRHGRGRSGGSGPVGAANWPSPALSRRSPAAPRASRSGCGRPVSVLRGNLLFPQARGLGRRRTVIPPADLTIAEAVGDGLFGELNLGAARRRVNRAGIKGHRPSAGDGAYTYARADLLAAARDGRRKDAS